MGQFLVLIIAICCSYPFVGGHVIRDVKSDLIANATELLKEADNTIHKLESEHKIQDVSAVKKAQMDIQKLVSELQTSTNASKIDAIEHDLKVAQSRLRYELRKVETAAPHPDLKQVLLNRAQALEKQSEEQIVKLKANQKNAEVTILEQEEAAIKKLAKDLEQAKTPADITRIENELQTAEYKLSYQIRQILDYEFREEAKKTILLKQATLIQKYAEETIKTLKADKKDEQAAELEKEEALLKKLVADIAQAKTETELHQIENALLVAEDKLYNHAKAINATADSLKSQLLKKAADLEKQATETITKLKGAKNDAEAASIEADLGTVKKLVQNLETAKTDADVKKIEQDLEVAESQLITRLNKNLSHF